MRKLRLAHAPTPLEFCERLSSAWGFDLFIKRDDATGGVEAGNKVRKLEYLLADAEAQGADTVITCGALQSNHCRATVALARKRGLDVVVLLRTESDLPNVPTGNLMLMQLAGARIVRVTPDEYAHRAERMDAERERLRQEGRTAYVIAEGGSSSLGVLGYVDAMREIAETQEPKRFDAIVHACGSGGTAAGVALGASAHQVANRVHAVAVCDSRAYFEGVIAKLIGGARALVPALPEAACVDVDDRYKGPRYGVASDDQRAFIRRMATEYGLFVDPVYTGKALYGLFMNRGLFSKKRVLFIHTGGLPGLLAEAQAFFA